jgi:beta-phosphoglucomutase-like phosphatase (HAD superfamily)
VIKAVLFDLDGVLVDATEWHYEALNKALGLFGYTIDRQRHLGFYNGLPTRVKLSHLTEEFEMPESLHDFIYDMKQQYTIDFIYKLCRPDFQKQLMFKHLKKKGFKVGVCSNSISETLEMMLRKSDLFNDCDVVISNQDVKKSKPDPEMYLKGMEALGVSPEETIIVEDSPHGIEAAEASGGHVCVVKGVQDVHLGLIEGYISKL